MINLKPLGISLAISLGTGIVSAVFHKIITHYTTILINRPFFSPPGFIFPVVWGILFILMGISSYIVYESDSPARPKALKLFAIQLCANFFWPIIFFNTQAYLFAAAWLFILLVLAALMTRTFSAVDKKLLYYKCRIYCG